MSVKVFLVLGFVACASQAFQLTKENNLAQKPELQNQLLSLKESAFSLGDQQVRQKVFNEIVAAPKAAVINVAQLLQKSANPEVSEVLDDFNDGLGFKVLAIEGEYVVLDSVAFENLLSQKARSISKAVNPNNYYQELIMFGTMQKKILELSPEIRAATQATKVPVDSILRANEYSHEFKTGSVKSYDSNQLPSNNPIEDTRSEASCLLTTGLLVGVFDGHGGGACAQVIAKRLFNYITACLLPNESLLQYVLSLTTQPEPPDLIESFNDKVQFVEDVRDIYKESFVQFVKELAEEEIKQQFHMGDAIERAFLRLDEDLSKEAMPKDGKVNMKTLSVAMSGAVSCVAHIDGPHLHVAGVGDCCAVLGSLSETNSWIAKKLTDEHNTYNQVELDRIFGEHPAQEKQTVIKMDRLLGQLAPLRAMGDFRFKWSKEIMTDLVAKNFGTQLIPPNYHTPPYLTAKPDVTYHKLTPRDKFLIIASDGLWDCLTPLQAIRLVGEHMKGKVTLHPLKLPRKNMKISEINDMLLQRKEGLKIKPKDSNAATHIIRNALGGTEYGIDHSKISQLLTLPDDVVRVFRDDMTVTIVYFDTEFLRHCPA